KRVDRVEAIRSGEHRVTDVDESRLRSLLDQQRFTPSIEENRLREADCISICVTTPLRKTRDPDLSFVLEAAETLARIARRGTLIILESTTYPGTTEEAVLPILEASLGRPGKDFFLCFSPERVD